MVNWHKVPITVGSGQQQRFWAVLGLTLGALALSFSLFSGIGWAISLPCCQEVEVSIQGLQSPGAACFWGGGCSPPLLAPLLVWAACAM